MKIENGGIDIGELVLKGKENKYRVDLGATLDKIQKNEVLVKSDGEVLKSLFTTIFTEFGHISEFSTSPECQKSILDNQLERLNTGRGRAIVTALDSDKTYQNFRQIFISSQNDDKRSFGLSNFIMSTKIGIFRAWADQESVFKKGLKKADDYSQRRGLENVLADSISLAWGTMSPDVYVTKLNQRRKIGNVEKPSTMVSIPKGSLLPAIMFITELCATPNEQLNNLKEKYELTEDKVNIHVVMGLDAKKPIKKQ